ncbi:hypothetical protein PR202_ga11767 [Eleusine coracana subsp. coracana]|uniref:Amine oxidase domain-containing protein n=1 Tax=Eleusine coracana subsp. coracana TaxID=191504 RepID=A0AAV5CAE4_ELECO|nr:hypothetical protein PR202_ga11767 [Eleusine coracana subsp. coracana]
MSPAPWRFLLTGARRRGFSTDASAPSASSQLPRGKRWDAVVIGGGHNGLVAAAYLARAGRSVAVLERRGVLGGAAVSESDLVPGFRFSRCSYLLSLLRPAILRDLELERHGLKLLPRSPSSFTPCLDGRYLLLGPDAEMNFSEISKFSSKDAMAYPRYEEQLEKFCQLMDFVIDSAPPELRQEYHTSMVDRMKDRVDKSAYWGNILRLVMQQGQKNMVSHVMVNETTGRVEGVALTDGTEIHSSIVLSNATPYKTFVDLLPANVLPENFLCSVKTADYSSATTKINVAVDRLPQFQCCKGINPEGGPEHMGTIHIGSESMEEIDIAFREAESGVSSKRPVIEMTIPSVLDKTISPPGQHVINLFIQYTPYKLSEGSWQDPDVRKSFAERCFSLIDEYAPGFSSSVVGYDMLTPPDLEREFGLTGGNIFHGSMGLDSLFLMRPAKGWSDYRTPVKGLYLCGSGAHPGGGVMGAPGRNAASIVLEDLKVK